MGILAIICVRALEAMFVTGMVGSAIVLVLTSIEDVETLISSDDTDHS